MKEHYVQRIILEYVLDENFDAQFHGDWVDEETFSDIVARMPFEAFAAYDYRVAGKYGEIAEAIIDALLKEGAISKTGDPYAGYWYRLNLAQKDKFAQTMFAANTATKRLRGLPEAAFDRALQQIAEEDELSPLYVAQGDIADLTEVISGEVVPAADRVVSLKHNQQAELENPLNDVISLVEHENSIDGEDGLRELVVGRLKAGRELLRAGIFSIRSLELTLIVGLKLLVEKYQDHAIGAIAGSLLDLLIEAIRNA